mmetsp:Transcript_12751/g.39970  ORF Transcript_12751/g.39970 Transcript_12751/m.39970 type:complete len:235 (+) Transcript_12751:1046-1750(+)
MAHGGMAARRGRGMGGGGVQGVPVGLARPPRDLHARGGARPSKAIPGVLRARDGAQPAARVRALGRLGVLLPMGRERREAGLTDSLKVRAAVREALDEDPQCRARHGTEVACRPRPHSGGPLPPQAEGAVLTEKVRPLQHPAPRLQSRHGLADHLDLARSQEKEGVTGVAGRHQQLAGLGKALAAGAEQELEKATVRLGQRARFVGATGSQRGVLADAQQARGLRHADLCQVRG